MTMRADIASRIDVPGVSVQIRDYIWHQGDHVSSCEHDFVVAYRPYPSQISVAAHLPTGKTLNFGQLMVFPANLEVEAGIANKNERVRNIWCRFDPEWMRRHWEAVPAWDAKDLAKCFDIRNARIEQILQLIGAEVAAPGLASNLFVESLSHMVAIEIARYFNNADLPLRVRTREGKLSQLDCSRIIDYIECAENHCPSMEEIATAFDISQAHLRRSFKRTTGGTIFEYAKTVRLRKAKALLEDTDLPIKVISYRLGFGNTSTFSTTFKRWAAESPGDYRDRVRGMLNPRRIHGQ